MNIIYSTYLKYFNSMWIR